ncbi:Trk system potassium uptake protein TrkH [Pigmentiphaga humi]|uniref:Trk system potassium uptake protein n=1 Tax=Pigmentiphaga humi TaxID=2478468 RepID=A0A3P4B5N7_9BURK|nr:potassium transporter TrkG [Pigmentiphaga humi]VCU70485.1 Trk system potassium uptake protein TrkH [Pigmentiphaga humi]
MRKLLPVLNVLGLIIVLFAATMAIPLGVSVHFGDGARHAFTEAMAVSAAIGLAMHLLTRRSRRELTPRDGFLLVSLVWSTLAAIAALPLLLYYHQAGMALSVTDAYFEAMSGLTTTGATVLSGLDGLPHSINVWRCTLIWIGGMGILVLAVAILPMLGAGGSQIFRAELPGPMKDEKLTPRITGTAKGLYAIYMLFSLLCALAYRAAGMSWYDAYCHMASTIGLGGFSNRDAGFAAFNSPAVEFVSLVFMIIAGISFTVHFQAFRRHSLGPYGRSTEAKAYLAALAIGVALITVLLYTRGVYDSAWTAFRYALFNTVSVATTTGFANTDYSSWPIFAPVLMLVLSCFATSAGSTGGGIKMIRLIILIKQARREFIHILHPRAINPIRVGGLPVSNQVVYSVLAYILLYWASLMTLTMAMLFTDLEPVTAFTAVLASLNNTGPGLGMVGPMGSFAELSDVQTWICTFAMLIGRLELFAVLVLFTRAFWRK